MCSPARFSAWRGTSYRAKSLGVAACVYAHKNSTDRAADSAATPGINNAWVSESRTSLDSGNQDRRFYALVVSTRTVEHENGVAGECVPLWWLD